MTRLALRPMLSSYDPNCASKGAELWLIGRVFNRGLKPARNVRVAPNLTNRYGTRLPSHGISLYPSDVPPTSFADFEGQILLSADTDVIAHPTAEWDP